MSGSIGDPVVYLHPNGRDYVALLGEDDWQQWPAEQGGWQRRAACPATVADACEELEPRLASLALRLSGVVADGE
ncbi:MAG TPA: hypothetical protein VE953_08515 [Terriglobales bacterium]|nr:hypothetical protein [Terriglobales bacterium]